jgi:diaminopropionate ammonia-lyase
MTMLTETDKQLAGMNIKGATHVIASVGVGSWAQAVTMHYKSKSPSATVITVEPDTAASLKTSLEAGHITSIETGTTIMNGMNCGTVSTTAWKILKEGVDASVTVTDIEVHHDLRHLDGRNVKIGPCGAAPLSALRRLCQVKKVELGLGEESVVVLFSTEGPRDYVVPDGA